MAKVKILKPVSGLAYFPGDFCELEEKKAETLAKSRYVEIQTEAKPKK